MLGVLQSTPYTPIFPPPLPDTDPTSLASRSCDSALTSSNGPNKTSQRYYIDGLKERYLLLSGLPEELCPPSRETSPGAEARIEALTLRMRNACELHRPLEVVLTCVGVKGGDWVGVPSPDGGQSEKECCLPATEEEWFEWEHAQITKRINRRAERKASLQKERIEKWSQGVEEGDFFGSHEVPTSAVLASHAFGSPGLNGEDGEDQPIASPHQASGWSNELLREQSDPVERRSSLLPLANVDALPEFDDAPVPSGSPPSLPYDIVQSSPKLDESPLLPSFDVGDMNVSTPIKRNQIAEPILQLSSPISPPRSLRPLVASQTSAIPVSSKRPHESNDLATVNAADGVNPLPSTPHVLKRAKIIVQPITPKSVERLRGSPDSSSSQEREPKRLPTLESLLIRSSKKASSRRGTPSLKGTGQRKVVSVPVESRSPHPTPPSAGLDMSSSQPRFDMFRPQFKSTQRRASSLPPSPSQPLTSTQSVSPQKMFGAASSSGIGFYHSQFDVERRVDQVATFLDADVWDLEA